MKKAVAVLISDVHYNIQTLPLADAAMRMAVAKANALNVPLVVAGDLHDTKANLRGECVNAMLETFKLAKITSYVLRGNHDAINERSKAHSLNFLQNDCILVDEPMDMPLTGCHGIPYYHDPEELRAYLKTLNPGAILIMHQGVTGSLSGEYMQDKSALTPEDFEGFRVISGHYHARQDIECGETGLFSYIGNPYTLTFGEAKDPEKGFMVLNEDGSLDFVPTNLRKHRILELNVETLADYIPEDIGPSDLIWVKLTGTREELSGLSRKGLGEFLGLTSFKLDTFPLNTDVTVEEAAAKAMTQPELLDATIDSAPNVSSEQKNRLKTLWRSYFETT